MITGNEKWIVSNNIERKNQTASEMNRTKAKYLHEKNVYLLHI